MQALAILAAVLFLQGCAALQTARTDVYVDLPDGRKITYSSSKDQAGIDLEVSEIDPRTGKVTKKWIIRVEKSGTPEAAYTALARQQESLADLFKAFIPLMEKVTAGIPMGP